MKTFHKTIRLRPLRGEINKADEIFVLVDVSEEHAVWASITKTSAKSLVSEAEELGLEEISGITVEEEDGVQSLYFDGPDADGTEGEDDGTAVPEGVPGEDPS